MTDLDTVIGRLRAALVEALPRRSTVSEDSMTFYCSDDIAVTAKIFVQTDQGARIAVISGSLATMMVAILLGYDLADEVWAVDADVGQVEQFGKGRAEPQVLG
jgi:hypothetical protein